MKIQQFKFSGGYTCPHFVAKKNLQEQKTGCCGRTVGDDFIPVCTLVNGLCPGLVQCARLDIKTKSELIKEWRGDLQSGKSVIPKVSE